MQHDPQWLLLLYLCLSAGGVRVEGKQTGARGGEWADTHKDHKRTPDQPNLQVN